MWQTTAQKQKYAADEARACRSRTISMAAWAIVFLIIAIVAYFSMPPGLPRMGSAVFMLVLAIGFAICACCAQVARSKYLGQMAALNNAANS